MSTAYYLALLAGVGAIVFAVLALGNALVRRALAAFFVDESGDEGEIERAQFSTRKLRQARGKGAEAAMEGKPIELCPYREKPLRMEWLIGHTGWHRTRPISKPPAPARTFWQRRNQNDPPSPIGYGATWKETNAIDLGKNRRRNGQT